MKLETYLSYASLFDDITGSDSVKIIDCLTDAVVTVCKNDAIATAGEAQTAIGLLIRGQAYVYAHSRRGENKYMSTLSTGDCFGLENVSRLIEGTEPCTWVYSVIAAKECQVGFLDTRRMSSPCGEDCACHKVLLKNLIRENSRALYRQSQRIELLTVKSMRGRIAGYLLQRIQEGGEDPSTVSLPFNRNRMAAYLDVSRPSMSRELACMKEEGILDYYLDTIQILDMDKLLIQAQK